MIWFNLIKIRKDFKIEIKEIKKEEEEEEENVGFFLERRVYRERRREKNV